MKIRPVSSFFFSILLGVAGLLLQAGSALDAQDFVPHPNANDSALFDTGVDAGSEAIIRVIGDTGCDSTCGAGCTDQRCASRWQRKRALKHLEKYGEPKITLTELWRREVPSGTQSLHFPYHAERLYYYRHPYNSSAIREAQANQALQNQQLAGPYPYPGQPYHTNVFESVYQSHASNTYGSVESRTLEFVDWQKHADAKTEWEANEKSPPQSNEQIMDPPLPMMEAPEDDSARLSGKLPDRQSR